MDTSHKIRGFRWSDLPEFAPLYNDIAGVVHTERAYTVPEMKEWLGQPSLLPEDNCFVAEGEEGLAGYALVTPELPIGRTVVSGGVSGPHRRHGLGRRLLRTAIERSHELGASLVNLEAQPDNQEAQHLLRSEGFQEVKSYWLMRWEKKELPPFNPPDGFSIRSFLPGEDSALLTGLQNATFRDNWGFSPNTEEEIDYRTRLSWCHPEGILIMFHGGDPAAYNWTFIRASQKTSTGVVGMTGVHPNYRGKGLGRVVLMAGMDFLLKKNVQGIELEVDQENAAATGLYLSLGFRKIQESLWYERRLEP